MDTIIPNGRTLYDRSRCGRPSSAPLCVHCKTYVQTRPGGLCNKCWHNPLIRVLYVNPVFAVRQLADYYGRSKLPATPTNAIPGSEEKIRVLADRASRGECLWHPLDGLGIIVE